MRSLQKHGKRVALIASAAIAMSPIVTSAQENAPQTAPQVSVQLVQPGASKQPDRSAAPLTITLPDAIARAQKIEAQYLGAVDDAKDAHEDRLQARAAMLPSATATSQYLGTQGNGKIPGGRFVTNDGVHVYRAWGVFHQDLSPATYLGTSYRRATAAEALAAAKAEIARRGLTVTVTRNYYGLGAAQQKYAATQRALDQARRFLENTQALEQGGQAAHADVVRAQIQAEQQQQSFDEAALAMEDARLNLAVLLFPTLDENFSIVDDLAAPANLPSIDEVQALATKANPDLRIAIETLHEADQDVAAAKGAFLPSFNVEMDYGIEANHFALRSLVSADPGKGPVDNLGYFVTAGVTIPVWDWGSLRSKLHQAETNRERARAELSQSQRETIANLFAAYNEASVSHEAVESARRAADLGAESLRLINLRYQDGESTALEVVDAQNTATQTSAAFADARVRYRVALANLQTLTGTF
jgi:outer membrane protein TolC